MAFRAAVLAIAAAMLVLFSTPLWWVPAVAGVGLAVICFTKAGTS